MVLYSKAHLTTGPFFVSAKGQGSISVPFFFHTLPPFHLICQRGNREGMPRRVCYTRFGCRTVLLLGQHYRDKGNCQDTVQVILGLDVV